MAYVKKVHRFRDCGSNMGAGDRSDGSLTADVTKTTCGACKQRVLDVILKSDWQHLRKDLVAVFRDVAVQIDGDL